MPQCGSLSWPGFERRRRRDSNHRLFCAGAGSARNQPGSMMVARTAATQTGYLLGGLIGGATLAWSGYAALGFVLVTGLILCAALTLCDRPTREVAVPAVARVREDRPWRSVLQPRPSSERPTGADALPRGPVRTPARRQRGSELPSKAVSRTLTATSLPDEAAPGQCQLFWPTVDGRELKGVLRGKLFLELSSDLSTPESTSESTPPRWCS
jgi:hypothetical protein